MSGGRVLEWGADVCNRSGVPGIRTVSRDLLLHRLLTHPPLSFTSRRNTSYSIDGAGHQHVELPLAFALCPRRVPSLPTIRVIQVLPMTTTILLTITSDHGRRKGIYFLIAGRPYAGSSVSHFPRRTHWKAGHGVLRAGVCSKSFEMAVTFLAFLVDHGIRGIQQLL